MKLTAKAAILTGFYASITLSVMTIISFGLGITATPGGRVLYPYLDTLKLFPRDYFWMVSAMVFILAYAVMMVSIHSTVPEENKIFSQIGIVFTIFSAVILLADYYIQLSVVPVSLMNNEITGITLITQYNPHGIFIVLEELGYIMMSLSFLFMAFVFHQKGRLGTSIKWIFISAFILTILAFGIISFLNGIERKDYFEVAIISITWLTLIVNGILVGIFFRKQLKAGIIV